MHNVFLDAGGIVRADRSRIRVCRVRGAHDLPVFCDRVLALQGLYDDRTRGHVADEVVEKRPLLVDGVETLGLILAQMHHSRCHDFQPRFLEAARAQPDALVLGTPIFDDSIPWHRRHGRKFSKAIVWIETWSTAVHDPLCGFRCIPLSPTLSLLDRVHTGDRMDFDPELVIRLVRAGVPVVNVPTAVDYPEGGISHFRMLEDNLRITWAYVRLAFEVRRPSP